VGTGEQRSAEWDLACLGHTTPWDRGASGVPRPYDAVGPRSGPRSRDPPAAWLHCV